MSATETLEQNVLVAHAMTRDVLTISPDATLWEASHALTTAGISGMPVVNESRRLVGVLSEKDIARALGDVAGTRRVSRPLDLVIQGQRAQGPLGRTLRETLQHTRVSEVMSRDPVVTSPTTPLDIAATIMTERRINRLPVVEGNRLVGILTRHDILSALYGP